MGRRQNENLMLNGHIVFTQKYMLHVIQNVRCTCNMLDVIQNKVSGGDLRGWKGVGYRGKTIGI